MYMANLAKHASPFAMISPCMISPHAIYSFKLMKQITIPISVYLMICFNKFNQMHQVCTACQSLKQPAREQQSIIKRALQLVSPNSCSNSFPGVFYSYVAIFNLRLTCAKDNMHSSVTIRFMHPGVPVWRFA